MTQRPSDCINNRTGFTELLIEYKNMCRNFTDATCKQINNNLRALEICGLTISMVSICIALGIYFHYRSLRNCRTKIHINLFCASLLHILCRLILYALHETVNVTNPNIFYQGCIILMEFSRTTVFAWNFIEGLYLHNIIIVAVLQQNNCFKMYYLLGWIAPAIMTFIWTMLMVYQTETCTSVAWILYPLLKIYWVLEGFRCILSLVNCIFLLNIIRVLVIKLKNNHCREIEQLRKAIRGAILLFPLLGIPSLAFLMPSIYDKPWKYVLWAFTAYSLVRFEGFFIVLFYCFLNEEVKTEIRKSVFLLKCSMGGMSNWVTSNTKITEQTNESTKPHMCENQSTNFL